MSGLDLGRGSKIGTLARKAWAAGTPTDLGLDSVSQDLDVSKRDQGVQTPAYRYSSTQHFLTQPKPSRRLPSPTGETASLLPASSPTPLLLGSSSEPSPSPSPGKYLAPFPANPSPPRRRCLRAPLPDRQVVAGFSLGPRDESAPPLLCVFPRPECSMSPCLVVGGDFPWPPLLSRSRLLFRPN